MHDLAIIIAVNQPRKQRQNREDIATVSGNSPEAERARWERAKRASRTRYFEALEPHPLAPQTLRDQAHEVVTLYLDAPDLTAEQRLLLRFALAILGSGINGASCEG